MYTIYMYSRVVVQLIKQQGPANLCTYWILACSGTAVSLVLHSPPLLTSYAAGYKKKSGSVATLAVPVWADLFLSDLN